MGQGAPRGGAMAHTPPIRKVSGLFNLCYDPKMILFKLDFRCEKFKCVTNLWEKIET